MVLTCTHDHIAHDHKQQKNNENQNKIKNKIEAKCQNIVYKGKKSGDRIKENTVSTFIQSFLSIFSFFQIKVERNRSNWIREILK